MVNIKCWQFSVAFARSSVFAERDFFISKRAVDHQKKSKCKLQGNEKLHISTVDSFSSRALIG